jgi:hypothetical protein
MSSAPSVLLLDDGELDHVHRMLKRLGVDYVRLQNRQIRGIIEQPRDILISSCERTLEMPQLEPSEGVPLDPVWVCVHNQDFLPLRQRLRELGVHYLVHAALDQESLRLFLLQLLYRGPNPRKQLRLPLGDRIQCGVVGAERELGKLVDLTSGMCRILSPSAAEPGTAISIVLPESLGGEEKLELQGPALRCAECESRSGEPAFSILVRLDDLDPKARAQIDRLVCGEQIGTRVTPLAERSPGKAEVPTPGPRAEVPEPPSRADATPTTTLQRRPRWEYQRRVDILDFDDMDASQTALGRDLSTGGVRIVEHSGLEVGSEVTLALYGGRREEPVVVEATVARDDGKDGVALIFNSVSDSLRRALEKLCSSLPPLESLREGDGEPEQVVVAQVTPSKD